MSSPGITENRAVRFDWIGESWHIVAMQQATWVLSTLIFGAIYLGALVLLMLAFFMPDFPMARSSSGVWSPSHEPSNLVGWISTICFGLMDIVLSAFFVGGLLKMANKQVRGLPIQVGDLFTGKDTFVPLVLFQLVFHVPLTLMNYATDVPIIAHHLPAPSPSSYSWSTVYSSFGIPMVTNIISLVLYGLFWPAAALIADREPVGSAISVSWNAMKRHWFMASLLMLVFAILAFLSAIPCLLGLLVTVPMFMVTSSLMYRDMIGLPEARTLPSSRYFYSQTPTSGVWPPPVQTPLEPSGGESEVR